MEAIRQKDIIGWGVDADKKVRPAYPMWKEPEEGTGAHWEVPEQQPNFHDFYSIERPRPTRVFGNTVPPTGLSGFVRGIAFKYSESSFAHWFLLMFADRINVFEGLIDDVSSGTRPGLLKERGWEVDKKFKTKRYKKMVFFGVAAASLIPILLLTKKKNSTSSG